MVDAAQNYIALVTTAGELYTWGGNLCQQTGTGSKAKELTVPTRVDYFTDKGLKVDHV